MEVLESLSFTLKETVMNTLDIFVKKGRQEGVEIGRQKARTEIVRNLIKISTLTDEQIASASDVTIDFVAQIRLELAAQK